MSLKRCFFSFRKNKTTFTPLFFASLITFVVLSTSTAFAQGSTPQAVDVVTKENTLETVVPTTCPTDNCAITATIEDVYQPSMTNTYFNYALAPDEFYDNPYQVSLFSTEHGEDRARLWSQSKSIFALGFVIIGAIALLPEDVSGWKSGEIFGKWGDNVKDGPVWDRDGLGLNVVGHGYFGGVFYQTARKSGYRQWDSFMYATLMSTFYWEYGIEAFAEVPSIQDLVLTPVIGWVYGEWAYQTEQSILRDGGTVWGSDTLGSISMTILDPIDSISGGINNLFGHEIFIAGTGYWDLKDQPIGTNGDSEQLINLGVTYQFGDGKTYSKNKQPNSNARRYSKDPVDTGIVGVSLGYGGVNLNESWEIEDGTFTEVALGLYFSKSFSSRLLYDKGYMKVKGSDAKIRYENYSINSQYYFNTQQRLRPFVSVGFGEMMRDKDREKKTFQVAGGAGLHYQITHNLALQVDGRYYYSTSTNTDDSAVATALVYRFAGGEK